MNLNLHVPTFSSPEKYLALAQLPSGYATTSGIVGRLESFQVLSPSFLLMYKMSLPVPLKLRIRSTGIDP